TLFVVRCKIDAPVEEEVGHGRTASPTSVEERQFHLLSIRLRPGRGAFIKIAPQQIELAQRSRAFHVQRRTEISKELGCHGLSICDAGVNNGLAISAGRRLIESRATIQ